MTSTTFEATLDQSTRTTPAARLRSAVSAHWAAYATERRATRAYRAQERAFGSLCGGELDDVLAASRRA